MRSEVDENSPTKGLSSRGNEELDGNERRSRWCWTAEAPGYWGIQGSGGFDQTRTKQADIAHNNASMSASASRCWQPRCHPEFEVIDHASLGCSHDLLNLLSMESVDQAELVAEGVLHHRPIDPFVGSDVERCTRFGASPFTVPTSWRVTSCFQGSV